jgi:prepilin-type N-terminal cleavage/methylation domain-containing protein
MACYCYAMSRGKQTGFTLLETLVTIVVLSFLMAGLVQGLRTGVTAWQTQTRKLAARGDLDAADRALRALIARMDPGGFSTQHPTFRGTSHNLVLTTTLPHSADALLTPEADVTLAVDDVHQLQLLWLPHYRTRIRPTPLPERVMLLRDVDHLEIAYWQDPKSGWQPEWAERALPKLIRIRVVFTRDSGRHAPDIVIMPMRDRWRQ